MDGIGFLQQDIHTNRMPKHVKVKTSDDDKTWTHSGDYNNLCASEDIDGWHQKKLRSAVEARYLQIEIYSNCGDNQYLTLRGLRISPSSTAP